MEEFGGLIRITNDISLGNVFLLIAVVIGTCKGVRTLRGEFRRMVFDLHEGVMLSEERKVEEGERTTLFRIIEKVTRRLIGEGDS